jgi:2-amino-4-hydroxy-6-hydroxymethyldihydropteridine diphosphokinase
MRQKQVYLSLGSNLGDRTANLKNALTALQRQKIAIVRESSIYETEPQNMAAQPWFLNMVIECRTELFPIQLLNVINRIENQLGRNRAASVPKGPRIIDIDILFYGRAVINTFTLSVPHPRIMERRFVLEPLCEIAPDLRHPVSGVLLKEQLQTVQTQMIRRYHLQRQPDA